MVKGKICYKFIIVRYPEIYEMCRWNLTEEWIIKIYVKDRNCLITLDLSLERFTGFSRYKTTYTIDMYITFILHITLAADVL